MVRVWYKGGMEHRTEWRGTVWIKDMEPAPPPRPFVYAGIEAALCDSIFYGEPDAEIEEDVFGKWFIETFGEAPVLGDRLPDPEFNGLIGRYGAIRI